MADFREHIRSAVAGPLSREDAATAFDVMMSGEATPAQIGGFLMALRMRGETVDEIAGAVSTMRAKMLPVSAPPDAIDIVGTGGDASGTYNISTTTAIVLAGCGTKVAKHGNRALSSKTGAADALVALGVNIDIGPDLISRCISEAGVGFMFAPAHHSAMKNVGPSRAELGTRTIFNLLGPLSNPASVKRQVVGVFDGAWIEPLAKVLGDLGSTRVWVVHGADGLDELTTTGPTHVAALEDGVVRRFSVTPEDAGLDVADPSDLKGGEASENAAAIRDVLEGKPGAFRDIVLLNAAAGLVVAGVAASLRDGAAMAATAIDEGAAHSALESLVRISNAPADD